MNHKNKGLVRHTCGGFTLVELLITLAIISLLVGLLLPALSAVRKAAREAKQRAQLTTIELAISAFKNDCGDYPPSMWEPPPRNNYCGSQKLSEALLGWDLMGFHPKSAWGADGCYLPPPANNFVYLNTDQNLSERKGPYLELATANAFRLGISAAGKRDGLFESTNPLSPDRYVICDVFGVKKITLATGKTATAGMPILYYKANTSSKSINNNPPDFINLIYNVLDNVDLLFVKEQEDRIKHGNTRIWNPLSDDTGNFQFFYNYYIKDPKVTARPWPYRPDSYILISAGADGFYGTEDDIRNFGY
jgi:prepilin-type N-terminal cleavage/methylation domain-containing protein